MAPNESDIIAAIRYRATDPKTRTDMASVEQTELYPAATPDAIEACEALLKFQLPWQLKELFTGFSNGGFGPGYGLLGVVGGQTDDRGRDLGAVYLDFVVDYANNRQRWPWGLLPLCEWGSGIWSCVDCSRADGHVVTYSDDDTLTDTGQGLTAWFLLWSTGAPLWERMFDVVQTEIADPFSKRPRRIGVRGKPLGTPFASSVSREQ